MSRKVDMATAVFRKTFKQRFFMARLTKTPVLGKLIIRIFFDRDQMIYLPKDSVVIESQQKVRTIPMNVVAKPKNVILPSQVVEHFINESRYIFLMNHCLCRESNSCRDYPKDLGCIFLGKGATRIPENMGRMVTRDEALEHLRKAREAGLVHLIGRNKIDSVWLDTGPKENLLSICNCCPCCCLWKMIPYISPVVGDGITRMPGVDVFVNKDKCLGCRTCVRDGVCFVKAISIHNEKAQVNIDLCKGCGRCVDVCQQKAIELRIRDDAYFDASIARIEPLVDVRSG